jgi:hypothetical protein
MAYDTNILESSVRHQQPMLKIEVRPILRRTIDGLLNTGPVVWMRSFQEDIYRRLIGSVAF